MITRKLKSYIYRKVYSRFVTDYSEGIAPLPNSVRLFPTLNCNLRCTHCNVPHDYEIEKELNLDEYEKLIYELKKWPTRPFFYFIGGEPLLYKNIIELFELLDRNNFEVVMTTNGFLLDRYAEKIVNLNNIKSINVSVDGQEKYHNLIRGNKNAFKKTIEGIKAIDKAKKKGKKKNPKMGVSYVILPENYQETYSFLEEINLLPISSILIHHFGFATKSQNQNQLQMVNKYFKHTNFFPNLHERSIEEIGISNQIVKEQIGKIEKNKNKFGFTIRWYRGFNHEIMSHYYDENFISGLNEKMSCYELYNLVNIDPYGDVFFCGNYYIGSIRESRLADIINSEKATLFRKNYFLLGNQLPACDYCNGFCMT